MGQSAFTGPVISLGGFAGGPAGGSPAEYSVELGPSIFWQGLGLLAVGAGSKDQKGIGAFPALFLSSSVMALSQVIQPAGVVLAGPANAVNGTPLALTATYAVGKAPGTPFAGALGVGIDTGFASCATTANNQAVTVAANDSWRFSSGQFVS